MEFNYIIFSIISVLYDKKEKESELTVGPQVQIFVAKNSSYSCLPPSIMVMPVKIQLHRYYSSKIWR